MVGRGVIVPDPDLDMDSIGIPEDKAWETYRPHVVHRLSKRGIPWALASLVVKGYNADFDGFICYKSIEYLRAPALPGGRGRAPGRPRPSYAVQCRE